jgi:hypothetical protein
MYSFDVLNASFALKNTILFAGKIRALPELLNRTGELLNYGFVVNFPG